MDKKRIAYWIRIVCKIGIWIVLIMFAIKGFEAREYFKQHPKTEYVAEWGQAFPQELYNKIAINNELITIIWIGLGIVWIFIIADYVYKPETHFFSTIKKKVMELKDTEE